MMLRPALLLAVGLGAAWHLHVLGDADAQAAPMLCRHGTVEVGADSPVPGLQLHVERDSVSGWNLRIDTQHFSFSPEGVNGPHAEGAGHAHLYVNQRKYSRLYGNWLHLPPLGPGLHELRITLNANDHRELARNGQVIEALATVQE